MRIFLPLVLFVAAVVTLWLDWQDRHTISFPQWDILSRCAAGAEVHVDHDISNPDFGKTEEIGCQKQDEWVGDIYGYDASTHALLYVVKRSDGEEQSRIYYRMETDHVTPLRLQFGLVEQCGGNVITRDDGGKISTVQYAFPCLPGYHAKLDCKQATITRIDWPGAPLYRVDCDDRPGQTFRLVNGEWVQQE